MYFTWSEFPWLMNTFSLTNLTFYSFNILEIKLGGGKSNPPLNPAEYFCRQTTEREEAWISLTIHFYTLNFLHRQEAYRKCLCSIFPTLDIYLEIGKSPALLYISTWDVNVEQVLLIYNFAALPALTPRIKTETDVKTHLQQLNCSCVRAH